MVRTLTRVAVDTSEAPLRALVDRLSLETAPHLMKPNGEELASFTGGDADTIESDPAAAAAAARTLVDRGVTEVLATLGPHGAVLVTADGAWHATPPPTEVVSTVGAGDSFMAGLLSGLIDAQLLGHPSRREALAAAGTDVIRPALARAVATSAVTVTHAGAYSPTRAELA